MLSSGFPLSLRLKVAYKGIFNVFRSPKSLLFAFLVSAFVLLVLIWAFNLNLLSYVYFQTAIPWIEKFTFIFKAYPDVLGNLNSPRALFLLVVSILMGVNITLLRYVGINALKARGGKGIAAMIAAIIGSGCAVCGTGILGPVLAGLSATGAVAVSEFIGSFAYFVSIVLLIFSILTLGEQCARLANQDNY